MSFGAAEDLSPTASAFSVFISTSACTFPLFLPRTSPSDSVPTPVIVGRDSKQALMSFSSWAFFFAKGDGARSGFERTPPFVRVENDRLEA